MEFKNPSELSNSELKLYMLSMENEFEAIKAQIAKLCTSLEEVDNEYKEYFSLS